MAVLVACVRLSRTMKEIINFAVIGAGGFAQFAVAEFIKIPGTKLVGVFDQDEENALKLKGLQSDIAIYASAEDLCMDSNIDLVYMATPPYLHYPQSKLALLSGKHVICEKPAAIRLEHAIELRELAQSKHLLYVVNLMQRYNKLYAAVTELIQKKVLGEFLHGFFENYASDEKLTEDHWFWDEAMSGGIFIEHGVHFFDMFSGWLGDGEVLSALKLNRPGHPDVWDKYQSTVQYGNGWVNFYHGFDQPKAMDRQEMRLQFERGEITLYEWVPTRLKMTALCQEEELQMLKSIFKGAEIIFLENHVTPKVVRGRFKTIKYNYKISLDTGDAIQKQTLYAELVTSMFIDQTSWIRDHQHMRIINQDNAVNSLAMAVKSEEMASGK
jgi:predicted dehydrogenase